MGNSLSAVHQAAMDGDISKLRVAVQEHPQRINDAEPTQGWTPLHIVAAKGYDVMLRELLARGAEPDATDKDGRTPLHLAAGAGQLATVQDLLRRRADAGLRDKAGALALDLAVTGGHTRVAAVLRDATPAAALAAPAAAPGAAAGGQYGYPSVPAPAANPVAVGAGGGGGPPPPYWAQQPPAGAAPLGGPGGLVSLNLPSAPPAAPGYLDYITGAPGLYPQPAYEAAAGAAIGGGPPAGGGLYPTLGGFEQPAAAGGGAYPPPPPPPPAAYSGPPPAAGGPPQGWATQQPGGPPPPGQVLSQVTEGDEDDWGAASDEWGSRSQSLPPEAATATGPSAAVGGGPPPAAMGLAVPSAGGASAGGNRGTTPSASLDPIAAAEAARQRLEKLNLQKVAGAIGGAIGGAAVAGAKHLLGGILSQARGGGGGGSGGSGRGGGEWPGGRPGVGGPGSNSGSGSAMVGPANRHYTYEELFKATQGFSEANKLGSGGYGPVYRGVLDGLPVAIKCLDTSEGAMQGEKEFLQEAQILGRLHHPHIVLLIGVCPACCMLVYELLDNGNLEEHILGRRYGDLLWQDRVRITAEVASALLFLHSSPEPIIHLDLKPANVLLNRNLTSKIGDVGLSRLAPSLGAGGASTVLDTRLVGTPAFMDPEYLRTGRFGPKSDTYSLGIVMMQLLTGGDARLAPDAVEGALKRSRSDPASIASIVDPRAGPWPLVEAASFAHLAARCAAPRRDERPDLRSEVLPGLLQLAERAAQYRAAEPARGPGGGFAGGVPGAGPGGGGGGGGGAGMLRRLDSIKDAGGDEPPSIFVCPITQDVMMDPVFAADGFTYEREAIAGWMASHNTSPMTNLPLTHAHLTPNNALRSSIKEYLERSGQRV